MENYGQIIYMFNKIYKHLPVMNFLISSTAFTFQVTVLNPWHKKISLQIKNIENKK